MSDKISNVSELPSNPSTEDVQKVLLSSGIASAASQFGCTAQEMDAIRKKYDLQLPRIIPSAHVRKEQRKARANIAGHILIVLAILPLLFLATPIGLLALGAYVIYLAKS